LTQRHGRLSCDPPPPFDPRPASFSVANERLLSPSSLNAWRFPRPSFALWNEVCTLNPGRSHVGAASASPERAPPPLLLRLASRVFSRRCRRTLTCTIVSSPSAVQGSSLRSSFSPPGFVSGDLDFSYPVTISRSFLTPFGRSLACPQFWCHDPPPCTAARSSSSGEVFQQ